MNSAEIRKVAFISVESNLKKNNMLVHKNDRITLAERIPKV